MKKVFLLSLFMLFAWVGVFAQTEPTGLEALLDMIPLSWLGTLVVIVGAYEIIVLAKPTVKDYSILSNVVTALKQLIDYMNRRKAR